MTRSSYWYQNICPCDLDHLWNLPLLVAFVFHKHILFKHIYVQVSVREYVVRYSTILLESFSVQLAEIKTKFSVLFFTVCVLHVPLLVPPLYCELYF